MAFMTVDKVLGDVRRGFGPTLCNILDSEGWTDVMINEDSSIWVERQGQMKMESKNSINDNGILNAARTLAGYANNQISEAYPSFSTVIPQMNLRVIFMVPPIVTHISAIFRKPSAHVIPMEDMVKYGTVTENQAEFLRESVISRKNIIMAGGTGSGKTTFANSLMQFIPVDERPIIIEDINELVCTCPNKLHILINPHYPYVAAVEASLRSNPDRIIVGECLKGDQTLQLLKAWNTGHPGGLTTIHATDAAHVVKRLDQLCMEVSASSQMEMIEDAIDIVVYMINESHTGRRYVKEILDVKKHEYINK